MSNIIIGRNSVLEYIKSGEQIEKLLILRTSRGETIEKIKIEAKLHKIHWQEVESQVITKYADANRSQGVVAIIPAKKYSTIENILDLAKSKRERPFIAVLDEIEDPYNLGAIIRSAEGAGIHGIIIPEHRAVGLIESVAKSSSGALAYMHIAKVTNISETLKKLKNSGIWIIGADQNAEKIYYEINMYMPVAIVIGNEGKGIRRLVKEQCDFLIKIPMLGRINSLNASVSAGLIFYEVVRQRKTVISNK
jgi:23S rRNA (guanosine2251-2'-O)-methyltransferase